MKMASSRSKRLATAKSKSWISNIWIKLLIVGTLITSIVQIVLHSNHDPVQTISTTVVQPQKTISHLVTKGERVGENERPPESHLNFSPSYEEETKLKEELMQTQDRLKSSEGMLLSYKKKVESLQTALAESSSRTSHSNSQPQQVVIASKVEHVDIPMAADELYKVRRSDCDLMLKQRTAIASMSEDYAFIKFNRGKVPFNSEWAACDMKSTASAVDSIHCLDRWLLRHCRAVVVDTDEEEWRHWVKEVALDYRGVNQLLGDGKSTSRNAYFIVACLHNNAALLKGGYSAHLLALAIKLRTHNALEGEKNEVFVSIYENDSTDATQTLLKELEKLLNDANIPNLILSETRGAAVEADRIDKLSFARNKALEPLQGLTWAKHGWVMFLNDVSFHATDMLQLLDTQVPYDMVCGIDHQMPATNELYDVWVNRDLDGHPLTRAVPHYTHPADKVLFEALQPIPVSCCWNGAVVVKSEVFSGGDQGVVFRRPDMNNELGTCDESECTTFCRDLYNKGFQNIYVNPRVHVSYAYESGKKQHVVGSNAPLVVPMWTQLFIAVNRAERYPLTMACCSLWRGANFAPKLGLFVGCHQLSQSESARGHMHQDAADIRSRLAEFIARDPRPALTVLHPVSGSKKKKRQTVEKVGYHTVAVHTSDVASEATLTFNRRDQCKSEYSHLGQQQGKLVHYGGVVDAAVGKGDNTPISRLMTKEDEWMVPPIETAQSFFSSNGVCARERETYRMSAGVAYRASYGPDMLLVSDKMRFICVVIWKVASRTLLKALAQFGATNIESDKLSEAQRQYTTFSFVRDPFTRYISGYFSTMKWVKMKRHVACVKALCAAHQGIGDDQVTWLIEGDIDQAAEWEGHPSEPKRFKQFTKRVLGDKGFAFPGVQHIFTQASFLSVTNRTGHPLFPRIDFIGKLENMSEDWARLMALLASRPGVPKPPVIDIPHRNAAPTSLTSLLKDTLLNNTGLLNMVCSFYIQDFNCFGYTLPQECAPPPTKHKK